ncbi:PDZ domain-containing protein [Pustulibacterium marinum]|uniref:PDZ domain-containing protein n=1 Tax=Pustulibacterium marinum TaxID=1224947 RepID=A0A1I7II42_9FLAO|nr:PDZ domain-containing protein [Pustulibacterium marinum]SFU72585.1 PDZ domain-containing protein [Pustulibacterium marinum]
MVGSFTLEGIPLSISTDQKGSLSNPNYLGILGNNILEKFTIVIDPKHQFLGLKPAENYQKKYKHIFKSNGFKENPDDTSSWILSFAYEDSPALKAGLREDDLIVAVNDVSIKELHLAEFIKNIKKNQKVRLKVKRKEKYVTIKFKWKPVLKR